MKIKQNDFERAGVYVLIDPRTKRPRYIGSSSCMKERLYDYAHTHLVSLSKNNPELALWLQELYSLSLWPDVGILGFFKTNAERNELECFWINEGIRAGWALLNRRHKPVRIKPQKKSPENYDKFGRR